MTRSERFRERYKSRVNVMFQTAWIVITFAGLGYALSHLPWGLSVLVVVVSVIIAVQMWGQWDEPAGE